MTKLNCCICSKEFKWYSKEHLQPYNGSEIRIMPSFGSDFDCFKTFYRGVICDGCSESILENLSQGRFEGAQWVKDKECPLFIADPDQVKEEDCPVEPYPEEL